MIDPATAQPAAEKATLSNLATEISLFLENTTDHAEAIDRIIEAHSRVVCSYCGDATVESMAVKDGIWTTDAKDAMQAHLLACPQRPERKLIDALTAQSAAFDAFETALRQIAEHPHCSYDHPSNSDSPYGTGCVDGHRCAASIAAAALAQVEELRKGEAS